PGVCACDGSAYCNECMVHAAGADTAPSGSCALPATCAELSHIVSERTNGLRMCTAVVRLSYQGLGLRGYRIICGPSYVPTEAGARARAQIETGFGEKGQLISGPSPQDELVFWEAPSPAGGAGVVSARSGASVFGGSIVSSGDGHITYPI